MPDQNMGTAHGKVRIEYESKGAEKSTAAMQQMQRQLETLEKKTKDLEAALNQLDGSASGSAGGMNRASTASGNMSSSMAASTAAAVRMVAQLTTMNEKLSSIDTSLKKSAVHLQDVDRGMHDGARSARGFSLGVFDAHKRVKDFNKDMQFMISDLNDVNRIVNGTRMTMERWSNAAVVLGAAGGMAAGRNNSIIRATTIALADLAVANHQTAANYAGWQRRIMGGFGAWSAHTDDLRGTNSALTLLGLGYSTINKRIKGLQDAMDTAPGWVRKMNSLSLAVGKTAGAMGVLGMAIRPLSNIQRFANTNTFTMLTRGSDTAARGFRLFANQLDKVDSKLNIVGRGFAYNFRKLMGPAVKGLDDSDRHIRNFLMHTSTGALRADSSVERMMIRFREFAKVSGKFVGGFAMISAGVGALRKQFEWFFKLPKWGLASLAIFIARVLPTALSTLGKALMGVSNIVVGLWKGLQQLSGGLLVLPGIIATIGAAASSIGIVFAGLKDKFKGIFSDDPKEAAAAWLKLPAHLRPIADALRPVVKQFKELQTVLQKVAFRGAEKQITDIGKTYMPLLERSMTPVIAAFRRAKDASVDFLLGGRTKSDVGSVYSNTATIIENLTRAIRPAAQGLLDIAKIGSDFLADQSVWAGQLSERFAQWVELNRKNGNLMNWMIDAKQGAYDLGAGLKDAAKGLYGIVTLFRTGTQANFLQKFADSMDRFNASIERSKSVGYLSRLRDTIKTMGADKMEDVKNLWDSFSEALRRAGPFINQVSKSFSDVFVRSLEKSIKYISMFLKGLNELGITPVVGWIAGIAAGLTMLPKVWAVATNGLKIFAGFITVLMTRKKVFDGLNAAFLAGAVGLTKFGKKGKEAADGLMKASGAFGALASRAAIIAGPLTAAVIAIGAVWAVIHEGDKNLKHFGDLLDDGAKQTKGFRKALDEAFLADNGLVGNNVLTALSDNTNQFLQHLRDLESATPGISEHVGDFFKDLFENSNSLMDPFPRGGKNWFQRQWDQLTVNPGDNKLNVDDERINKYQKLGDNAKRASQEFALLINEGTNLNEVIRMSDAAFDPYIQHLEKSGKLSKESADLLKQQRDQYKAVEKSMLDLGPAGVAAANAFKMIQDAAGDASQELDGIRKLMVALGFLTTDAEQAAADYGDAIGTLSEKVRQAILDGDGLSGVFDKTTGRLDTLHSQTARNLLPIFNQLSSSFMASVLNGQDVNEMLRLLDVQVANVANQLNLKPEFLKEYLEQSKGMIPEIIQLSDQLSKAQDETTRKAIELQIAITTRKLGGKDIGIHFDDNDVAKSFEKEMEESLGDVLNVDLGNVTLRPDIEIKPEDLEKWKSFLRRSGVQLPGDPPADPAKIAIQPKVETQKGEQTPEGQVTETKDNILSILQDATSNVEKQGNAYMDAFARGLEARKGEPEKVVENMLKRMAGMGHSSPPKRGPLAQHGDLTRYQGGKYVDAYAQGIAENTAAAEAATAKMASSATRGIGVGQGINQAGAFLGQLSELNQFFSHFVETLGKIGETILNFTKLMSDPLGKGTFFGKSLGYKKIQESTSDRDLRRQRVISEGLAGGRRNTDKFDADVDKLREALSGSTSGKQDTANYIIGKALEAGLTMEQAGVVLAQAIGESRDLTKDITSPNGLWVGIFQETQDFMDSYGTKGGDRKNAVANIDAWFKKFAGITGEDIYDRIAKTSVGGPITPGNPSIGNYGKGSPQVAELERQAAEYIKAFKPGTPSALGAAANAGMVTDILHDTGSVATQAAGRAVATMIADMFPAIKDIGGSRDTGTAKNTHDTGTSLDIMIPSWDTPTGKALGDRINNFLRENASLLGIEYTIWQNRWKDFKGNESVEEGHLNHIDVHFGNNAKVTMDGIQPAAGTDKGPETGMPRLPGTPDYEPGQVDQPYQLDANGKPIPIPVKVDQTEVPGIKVSQRQTDKGLEVLIGDEVVATYPLGMTGEEVPIMHEGKQVGVVSPVPGGMPVLRPPEARNPATGQPWQPGERETFAKENPIEYTFPGMKPADIQDAFGNPNITKDTLDNILKTLYSQDSNLDQAVKVLYNVNSTEEAQASALATIQDAADRQEAIGTPTSRYAAGGLRDIASTKAGELGFEQQQNPIDQAMGIFSGMTSMAGQIFGAIDSAIEAVGATKDIADTMVRGIENTEDIYKIIDDIQKYIAFAADVAGATSSVLGVVGSVVGIAGAGAAAGDSGGTLAAAQAIQVASQIAAMVQAVLETVNAVIDLTQEAYRIVGSYLGDFLGYLVGGPGGLQGDVKFLLDETAGKLYAYGSETPQSKVGHPVPGMLPGPEFRQTAGQINVYGGPGTDPRDDTRQMIFQIKAAQMTGALAS